MTWGNRAQRRADDFDALVERSSTGALGSGVDSRDAELLELVGALRGVPDAEPRAEFVADLRTRLMAEAATALVPTDVSRLQLPARRTRRERRFAAAVAGVVIAGATTSMAVASQSALPGESLYPIKRVLESAHAGLSLGEARKGSTELANASDRLSEASALARSDDPGDQARVASTLSTFTEQATSGADLLLADYAHSGRDASIAELRDFASSSLEELEALEPLVPNDARDELIAAAGLLGQIDDEAARQCPDCGGTPISEFPASLVSAAQPIELPTVPPAQQDAADRTPSKPAKGEKKGDGKGSGQPGASTTQLPDVDGEVPPGSVLDPGQLPSPSASDPLKALTDGLTSALTGGGSTHSDSGSGSGGTGSSAGPSPLADVVEGVTEILHGVLDPITGQLVPPQK